MLSHALELDSSQDTITNAESSEALMPGQRPKVRLMFRALGEDGQRLPMIPLFLSEEFVVTDALCLWQPDSHCMSLECLLHATAAGCAVVSAVCPRAAMLRVYVCWCRASIVSSSVSCVLTCRRGSIQVSCGPLAHPKCHINTCRLPRPIAAGRIHRHQELL